MENRMRTLNFLGAFVAGLALTAHGEVKITIEHNSNDDASSKFKFKNVGTPARDDAARGAKFFIIDGERDENGAGLEALNDGKAPTQSDAPADNFFFNAGTDGGRLLVDLEKPIEIKEVDTFSWHPGSRAPQVYKLYGSDGSEAGFKERPQSRLNPEQCGWKLLAKVDTRSGQSDPGGQYAVRVGDDSGVIGKYRYLLFAMSRTEDEDAFGNTFYSEIDVVDRNGKAEPEVDQAVAGEHIERVTTEGYEITVDTSEMPELTEWAKASIAPMAKEWYPKIVRMLPSDGYEAPRNVTITFIKDMRGVANTGGTRIRCAGEWFTHNLKGEAVGAVFHELVHVVQQYGRARRTNPNATRSPGWLTEGIPDYIRWFIFEPQTHGAEITKRNIGRARYDGSYRITANFLNWVTEKYSKDLVRKLNVALREGKYVEEIWKDLTGHTVEELGAEWKQAAETRIAATASLDGERSSANALSDADKSAGWKLLFNGKDLTGWHNFKSENVKEGWQVKDGTLACVDPHNAGDIVTADQFEWFELQLDYNISEGGNSGIMYHVSDEGRAAWASGPEIQLEDNAKAADPQRCGWLYALYQPPTDPNTGKPLDATKPAGQWNHIRVLISPEKCEHEVNGVKYFEYVLGSEDFNARVAKSKFGRMPGFAKSSKGRIALQGDHGQVSFRNIKVRPIEAKKS
jgi:hypothetical protein